MTEPPALPPPQPHDEPVAGPPSSEPARGSRLPWYTAAGFLVLAVALFWVWRHPYEQHATTSAADALANRLAALDSRLTQLEQRPIPQAPDLAPLTGRLSALEQRPAATSEPAPDLAPLAARVTALEQRPSGGSGAAADLSPLLARITALEQRPAPDLAPLEARIAALEARQTADSRLAARLDALSARADTLGTALQGVQSESARRLDADAAKLATLDRATSQLPALSDRLAHLARVQAAQMALAAGQKLGELPGAPSALARFADAAPPSEAALRLAFPSAAHNALLAARPSTEGKPLLARVWAETQDLVTIRQGDRVLVGDPTAGILERARTALDAGDLAAAVAAVGTLSGDAAQQMAAWLADARALLEARAALAEWAAHA